MIVGKAATLTAIVFVLLQPLVVPVIVYVIGLVGEAVTLAPVLALNPVVGDQVYVVAPPTDKLVDEPAHNEAVFDPVNVGAAPTEIGTLMVLLQPLAVPVSEYVMEAAGVATTVAPDVVFNPVDGDQE